MSAAICNRKLGLGALVAVVRLAALAAPAFAAPRPALAAVTLYDGALALPPEGQGWLSYGALPSGSFATSASGRTTLDTTAASLVHAGYTNYDSSLTGFRNAAFPRLDRTAGFTVAVDVRILAESHSSADRAGFSLIALASDLSGIEISFWSDRVWAQSSTFTHAEEALVDTTASVRHYELQVLGGGYTLRVDGAPLLSGSLRNYSATGTPYDHPSFLFAGDDTSSAQGRTEIWQWTLDAAPGCAVDDVAVPDGRVVQRSIGPGAALTFATRLHDRASYSVEAAAGEPSALSIAGFLPGDGCVSGSLPSHDTALADPPLAARVSVAPPGEGLYRFRVTNGSAGTTSVSLAVAETTLFSASWTTSGAFDTYYSFQNTTAAAVDATLQLTKSDGTVIGAATLTVPAGATVATNTASLGIARGAAGTARLTHDGPPGALAAEAAIASFAFTPAYVQPVRFRSVRER